MHPRSRRVASPFLLPMLAAAVLFGPALAALPAAASTAKSGGTCVASEEGRVAAAKGVTLVCRRSGAKRVWVRAAVATVPQATAAAAPTVAPASTGASRLVLADPFTNPDSGWPARRSETLDVGYQGTRSYGILVRGSQQQVGASSPIKTPLTNVTVAVEARFAAFVGGFSIGCYDTGVSDANTTRYDALVGHDDKWVISEFRAGTRTTLAAGDLRLGLLLNGALPNKFVVSCTGRVGGPGAIAMTLNGTPVASVPVAAMLPAGNVSLWAFTNATTPGAQILFDNFSLSTTS